MPDHTIITFTHPAPDGERWTPEAFGKVVGSTVPLTDQFGQVIGSAIVTTVLVAKDGRSARLTIATEDPVGRAIALPDNLTTKDQT